MTGTPVMSTSRDAKQTISVLRLADSGKARYNIVVGQEASPIERNAAELLAEYLAKASGATFPIVSDRRTATGCEICVGRTHRGRDAGQVGFDGFEIRVEGQRIFIFGGPGRGLINGVLDLLEEEVGCRWYAKDCEKVPKRDLLDLPVVPRAYTPRFKLRMPFHAYSFDARWSLVNRTNDPFARVPSDWGGHWSYPVIDGKRHYYRVGRRLYGHTYHTLMPPEDFFASHPEYFMLDGDGKRDPHQVCETHPDTLAIFTSSARKYLRESPDSQLLFVAKSDGGRKTCLCDTCRELNQREESVAASMLHLVNHVAEEIEADFPDVQIITYAYLETIKMPRTLRPRRNVIVAFCNDKCAWPHPFRPARQHGGLSRDASEWVRAGVRLYFWDYVINFSHHCAPMPNLAVIADNMRFWAENRAEGVMTNGPYQTEGAERETMRTWVTAKLMWNPNLDLPTLMDDFIDGYYGRAAPAMRKYHHYLEALACKYDLANAELKGGIRFGMDEAFVQDLVANAEGFILEALELAENSAVRKRVEKDWLSILYASIETWSGNDDREYFDRIDRFESIARKSGLTHLAEANFDTPDLDMRLHVWRGLKTGGLVEILEAPRKDGEPLSLTVRSRVPGMKPACTTDGSEPHFPFPLPEGDEVTLTLPDGGKLKVALYLPYSFCKTVLG